MQLLRDLSRWLSFERPEIEQKTEKNGSESEKSHSIEEIRRLAVPEDAAVYEFKLGQPPFVVLKRHHLQR